MSMNNIGKAESDGMLKTNRIETGNNHWRSGLLHPQQSVTNPSEFAQGEAANGEWWRQRPLGEPVQWYLVRWLQNQWRVP